MRAVKLRETFGIDDEVYLTSGADCLNDRDIKWLKEEGNNIDVKYSSRTYNQILRIMNKYERNWEDMFNVLWDEASITEIEFV